METVVEAFPQQSFEEVADAVNSVTRTPAKDELKKHFLAAKRIKKEVGILKFRFQSPTSVDTLESRTRTVFFDVAFLTKSELEKLLPGKPQGSAWWRKLALTEGQVPVEDKAEVLSGFYFSLRDFPESVARWCRKVRLAHTSEVRLEEPRLRPESQLRADQGQDLFKYYSSKLTRPARAAAATACQPSPVF